MPYLHRTAHSLKKLASRVDTKVVFSAPDKLGRICRLTDLYRMPTVGCSKGHRDAPVGCVEAVVHELPLSCRRKYIGQTGRCLNGQLREHSLNAKNIQYGHLSAHCQECGCPPVYKSRAVLAKHKDKDVREIIEAYAICQIVKRMLAPLPLTC